MKFGLPRKRNPKSEVGFKYVEIIYFYIYYFWFDNFYAVRKSLNCTVVINYQDQPVLRDKKSQRFSRGDDPLVSRISDCHPQRLIPRSNQSISFNVFFIKN